jgi:hypothetical protein
VREVLRRYTDLPGVIYLLTERTLTLLDPQTWDDSNDSRYLALYREKKDLQTVLAVCFTQSDETYHHWRVFAPGASGACVRFKRARLLNALKGTHGLRTGPVRYLKLPEIRKTRLRTQQLPFLKRYAFEHEKEYRVVYESKTDRLDTLDIDIPLSCIERVTLSPWLHPALSGHVKRTLHAIPGCSRLEVVRSTLIGNEEWKNLGEEAV